MRRWLTVLATLVVCSTPTWAGSIGPDTPIDTVDVHAWAVITAPATCPSCVEKIDVNFLFVNVSDEYAGHVVPGSLTINSSGFMGTFSTPYCCGNNAFYLGMWNTFNSLGPTYGDEFDLYFNNTGANTPTDNLTTIVPGRNNMDFDFWSCESAACSSAYGTGWVGGISGDVGLKEGSNVTTVPDGDSILPLSLSAFGAFALVWRWRRREV